MKEKSTTSFSPPNNENFPQCKDTSDCHSDSAKPAKRLPESERPRKDGPGGE